MSTQGNTGSEASALLNDWFFLHTLIFNSYIFATHYIVEDL